MGALIAVAILPGAVHAQPGQPPSPTYPTYPAYPPAPVSLTPEDQELLARGEISDGEIIGGGVVSIFLGFGLGHAVQGRYMEKGWLFTVGEAGSLAVFMVGLAQCFDLDSNDCEDGDLWLISGALGIVGFRIWELIDVFVGPGQHNARVRNLRMRLGYPPPPAPGWSLHLAPAQGGEGKVMGLTFRF